MLKLFKLNYKTNSSERIYKYLIFKTNFQIHFKTKKDSNVSPWINEMISEYL